MSKTGHEFISVVELPRGRHLYKFIVDQSWQFSPDQPTAVDAEGHVNNVIDTTKHRRFDQETTTKELEFCAIIPDPTSYTKEAPAPPALFFKLEPPANHPPPPSTFPLHGLANFVYHDAAVSSFASSLSTTLRIQRRNRQLYATLIYVTPNPLAAKPAPLTPLDTNPVRRFAAHHCRYDTSEPLSARV